MPPQKVLMYGAGKIGRGFMGQLFTDSGYQVVFVDIIPELVAALNERHGYRLVLVTNQGREERVIGRVRAVAGWDRDAVAREMLDMDLVATAVGVRSLSDIAPFLAEGIRWRMRRGIARPLNIIVCENLKDAPQALQGMIASHLPGDCHAYLADRVGLIDAVIDRMVPVVPPDVLAKDPSYILTEPYGLLQVNGAGFVGDIPPVRGMEAVADIQACVDRKLYLHNGGHAMLSYLGSLKGLTYGYEALADRDVHHELVRAWDETERALIPEYGFDSAGLRAYMRELEERWANRALSDTLLRLGRDPIRKLGPSDRLIGPARLALKHAISPEALSLGIAAGMVFASQDDPCAAELQGLLASKGLAAVLEEICDVAPGEDLGRMITHQHERIRSGAWPA